MEIKFGNMAKDKVTGFEGIVTGQCIYMYGCNQFLLTPLVKEDNTKQEGYWVDEGRVIVIGEGVEPNEVKAEENGGPQSHPSGEF
jgi:hypothetical protein